LEPSAVRMAIIDVTSSVRMAAWLLAAEDEKAAGLQQSPDRCYRCASEDDVIDTEGVCDLCSAPHGPASKAAPPIPAKPLCEPPVVWLAESVWLPGSPEAAAVAVPADPAKAEAPIPWGIINDASSTDELFDPSSILGESADPVPDEDIIDAIMEKTSEDIERRVMQINDVEAPAERQPKAKAARMQPSGHDIGYCERCERTAVQTQNLIADTATVSVDELRTLEKAVFRLVEAELGTRREYEGRGGLRENIAELVEDLVSNAIARTHAGAR
jgi:hypothetical protein